MRCCVFAAPPQIAQPALLTLEPLQDILDVLLHCLQPRRFGRQRAVRRIHLGFSKRCAASTRPHSELERALPQRGRQLLGRRSPVSRGDACCSDEAHPA
jgi:hypothetical protein